MKFESPLIEGIFLKRYKRFFADVEINGQVVVAHVPNTGSMKGCKEPGMPCLVSPATNPERKLRFTLEMVKTPESWVGVNTSHPNLLVQELWASKKLAHWAEFDQCQREVKISKETRLDMALWKSNDVPGGLNIKDLKPPLHFIEVKNVTLGEKGRALFPDAVTERGQKHVMEMMKLKELGYSCELVFTVQREDCKVFAPAEDIDPEYARLLREAQKKGVRITALPCRLSPTGVELLSEPLDLLL